MAEGLFEVGLGFSINDLANVIYGTADPSAGGGVVAPIGSIYMRDNSSTGELWSKTGAADTAWLEQQISGGASTEDGHIQVYTGKTGDGAENPTYSSNNVVSGNLEVAIGAIDAGIGAAATPETRTNSPDA